MPVIIAFARTHWKLIGVGLAFALLLAGFVYRGYRIDYLEGQIKIIRIDLTKAKARTEAEIAKHEATKRAYADAQAEAERMEQERLARVTARQKEITDDVTRTYRARVADARAAYDRLRRQAGSGSVGSPGGEQVPCVPDAGGRADDPACPLSSGERLTAELQAIQIEGLQEHIRRHATIPVN